jgi:hypothetical protein
MTLGRLSPTRLGVSLEYLTRSDGLSSYNFPNLAAHTLSSLICSSAAVAAVREVNRMRDVVSTSEAVRMFHMHPATVLRLILTHRVTAEKDRNGRWLIRRSDLEAWNSRHVRIPGNSGNGSIEPAL